ncbi:MAG: hypothetical protein HKN87_23500 [Saprospiraceae bacterium]|nr:hypothetical protein [Saprospiraceae bacterium]
MLALILISTLIPLYCYGPAVEKVNLQIIHRHKIVGQFSAQKSEIGDLTVYESNSSVTSKFIRVRISYQIIVVLKNGVLEESDLKMTVNGRLRTHSQTTKDGDSYAFFKNGKAKGKLHDDITHTTIMLYFDKPLGIGRTYSEEEGLFCEILGGAPDTYHKINSKGKKNTYRYDGELLRHLLIETTFMDFEMMLELGDGQAANTINASAPTVAISPRTFLWHPSQFVKGIRICTPPYLEDQNVRCKYGEKEVRIYHSRAHS